MKKNKGEQLSAVDDLYRAVQRYIASIGGTVVVIGGVEIQRWPAEPKLNYRLAVKITGIVPTKQPII